MKHLNTNTIKEWNIKRKSRFFKWTFPLLILPLFIWASKPSKYAEVEGHITEIDSNQNLIGAQVILQKKGSQNIQTTFTNEKGQYKFYKVRNGKYEISVSHLSYKSVSQLVKIKENKQNKFDFKLERANERTAEIVITYVDSSSYNKEKIEKKAAEFKNKMETARDAPPSESRAKAAMEASSRFSLDESAEGAEYDRKGIEAFDPSAATAGSLTAGELNDFAKFEMWSGIAETELITYQNTWKLFTKERFAVIIRNQENGSVINAKVQLADEKGNILWTSITNNAGRAELWNGYLDNIDQNEKLNIIIDYADEKFIVEDIVTYNKGINQITLPVACNRPNAVDIAFIIDATGSMGDEINYLKVELEDVISKVKKENNSLDINTASIFYRDITDDYVTRQSDFSNDIDKTLSFIKNQSAAGGGDMPEAVDSALNEAINTLSWRKDTRSKLLFLVLDAPPHSDSNSVKKMQIAIKKAAQKGIRIIPIVCSGTDKSNEFLMRSAALATNGTYIFLTDHSGIGGSHIAPTTDEFDVTYLNDLMQDVIIRFTDAISCANDLIETKNGSKTQITTVKVDPLLSEKYKINKNGQYEIPLSVSKIDGEIAKPLGSLKPDIDSTENLEINNTIYSIYPNPTSGTLNVLYENDVEEILLLDGSGQLLRRYQTPSKHFSINIQEYADGIYFLAFLDSVGKLNTERFILKK